LIASTGRTALAGRSANLEWQFSLAENSCDELHDQRIVSCFDSGGTGTKLNCLRCIGFEEVVQAVRLNCTSGSDSSSFGRGHLQHVQSVSQSTIGGGIGLLGIRFGLRDKLRAWSSN